MISRKALMFIASLIARQAGLCQNVRAADRTHKLFCPMTWPEDPRSKFIYLDFPTHVYNWGPYDFGTSLRFGVLGADKLDCFYANGRNLLIPIPGNPKFCFVGDMKSKPGIGEDLITSGYCTYEKTGDPLKDKIQIHETEPLNLSTSFYGAKLGMTCAQAAAVLPPRTPSGLIKSDSDTDLAIYVLKDQSQLALTYDFATGGLKAIELRPPLGHATGLQDNLVDRFGFPLWTNNIDEYVWRGEQKTRLVLEVKRAFGNFTVFDERLYFLDGRNILGLDKSLGLN